MVSPSFLQWNIILIFSVGFGWDGGGGAVGDFANFKGILSRGKKKQTKS